MAKRRNRIYRRIAVALTVALLVGQSHAFVLAEEGANDVPTTEISDEKKTDVETGEAISGVDTDGDAENVGEDDEEITGDETDPGTGAENREEETPEKILEENVPGNDDEIEEAEEPEEALTAAADGIETYASDIYVDHVKYEILENSGDIRRVQVTGYEEGIDSKLVIPPQITSGGETWDVVSIAENAFKSCQSLVNLEISGSVQTIGKSSFASCKELSQLIIRDGTKKIEEEAFFNCSKLESISIPDSVIEMGTSVFYFCTSLDNVNFGQGMDIIPYFTFNTYSRLSDVHIPNSVKEIDKGAFDHCGALSSIEIPQSVTQIWVDSFLTCANLRTMKIDVDITQEIKPITIKLYSNYTANSAWRYCPKDRNIIFMNADGTQPLSGEALDKVKAVYAADGNDGDTTDNEWYGWSLGEAPVEVDKYAVTVHVQKDNAEWTDNGRSFALSANDGDSMETNLNAVAAGTYNVFDVTGGSKINTGVSVDVDGNDDTATVDYYTVIFCDGDGTEYGDDTVLANVGRVTRPASNPVKEGHTFDMWVTEAGGNTEFSFATTPITGQTKIYAKWTENAVATYKVTINVKIDNGEWTDHGRSFALRKDGSDFITAQQDQTSGSSYSIPQVPNGTYRIYDITGVPAASLYSKARDTGIDVQVDGVDTEVDVTVNNDNAEAEINYYTATFYDGDTAYGAATPQRPQIILKGKQVVRPAENPSRTGYTFKDWVTEDGGRFEFETRQIEDKTDIYASWTEDTNVPGVKNYTINATAGAGGRIDPPGPQSVPEGGSKTFTIIPSEGYRIRSVMVNGVDMTEEIKEAGNTYTFTNVTENCTINATFESDGSDPGGNGDGGNSGSGDGDGDHSNSGNGDHGNTGSGNGDGGNSNGGDNVGGNSGGGNSEVNDLSAGSAAADGSVVAGGNSAAGSNNNGAASGGSTGSKEPKTGDASQAEVYATIAMIAGLTYLLLYVMEEGRGMSEQEKDALVAAIVRWAKKGGAFRRCCAMTAIFCVLAYYHSIGKRIGGNALNERCLGQLS